MRLIDADSLKERLPDLHGGIAEIICESVREIVDQEPTILPPNDPLTPEKLRKMDGEPVWNDTIKKYALVDAGWWDGIGRTINSNGKYRLLDDRYYRRRPEEGTV